MMLDGAYNTGKNVSDAVLSALRYYALFKYPLKADEIYGNMAVKSSLACLLVILEDLYEAETIYRYDGYYSLDKDVKQLVIQRKKANRLAYKKILLAKRVGKFISGFPFVRFVGVSGSLSKGYADSESDFDFFIVTTENRLWICRTLLHLFKKITFLFGQQHKFCMNYFIDQHNLEINEKNIFTAIELSSLVAVSGYETLVKLQTANQWVDMFLPNGYIGFNCGSSAIYDNDSLLKRILESLINRLFPEKVNESLMEITDRKWRKKWAGKNYPMADYNVAFKTTIHVSKNHPANHQKRILNAIAKLDTNYKESI